MELEKELQNRQCQSILLGQLQTDVERLHIAFNALEVKSTVVNISFIATVLFSPAGGEQSTHCTAVSGSE